jgi:hypothetical protein
MENLEAAIRDLIKAIEALTAQSKLNADNICTAIDDTHI